MPSYESAIAIAIAIRRVSNVYQRPRPLSATDRVADFNCTSTEQTLWLRHYCKQAEASSSARVFVVTQEFAQAVVA